MRHFTRSLTWATAVIIVLGVGDYVMGQGSGSSRVSPPRSSSGSSGSNRAVPSAPRPKTPTEFAASFWKYLHKPGATYRSWGSPGATQMSQASPPHSTTGRTFLNKVANGKLAQVPNGSMFVREEYAEDGKTIRNVMVMYRSKAADPKNGDWYWMMYQPDGKLARTSAEHGNREMVGRVQSCIDCHRKAAGKDYVFLNDRPATGSPQSTPPRR